jgi:hypothetical protein
MPKKGLKDYQYDYEGPTPKGFKKGSGAKLGTKQTRKPIEGAMMPKDIYPLSLGYEYRQAEKKKAAAEEAAKVYADYIAKHPIVVPTPPSHAALVKKGIRRPAAKEPMKEEKAMEEVKEKKARKPRSDKGMPRKKKM